MPDFFGRQPGRNPARWSPDAAAASRGPKSLARLLRRVSRRGRQARSERAREVDGEDLAPPHTPEDAFRQWDDPKVRGWIKLRRVLAQGAVSAGKPDEGDPEQERPAMISPPAAERGRYRGWFAAFEFREDGRWYCIQFTSTRDFSP